MSEPNCWQRGERYETCVDDGVRGSAPKLCMAYSRARCLPSPKGGLSVDRAAAFSGPSLAEREDCKGAKPLAGYILTPLLRQTPVPLIALLF